MQNAECRNRLGLAILAFQLFSFSAFQLFAADVQFPLARWCAPGAATNREVIILPLALTPPAGVLPVYDRAKYTSGTNGVFWVSNMFAGTYSGEILGPPDRTPFLFYVDPTNAVQNAANNVNVPTNAVPDGPDRYAYSASASEARYAPVILMPGVAPTAAFLNGTGIGTNHLIRNVSGALVDYWSDGTNLWSKQLAP